VQLSYFLTGEEASYKGFTPINTFNVGAPGWGAFEIVARYQELEIDDKAFVGDALSFVDPATQPRKATGYTLGLNWYFNQNFKWQVNYEHVEFEGGAANGGDRDDGEAILTRFAVGF
jgi:phosphate-selective porin OprO and OprP